MLLTDADIKTAIVSGQINFGNSFDFQRIQSSSVDLTAGKIYVPENTKNINKVQNFSDLAIHQCNIGSGETIIIELTEDIRLSNDIGCILLPPNSLTKNGIIMTNPGHIDPGYFGKLTVCLINMGKDTVTMEPSSVVATLLLFRLSSPSAGYQKGHGTGASLTQLSKLSKDFANISERSYSYIKKAIWEHLFAALTILSLALGLLTIVVPSLLPIAADLLETRFSETKNSESIKELKEQVRALQTQLEKKPVRMDEPAPAPAPDHKGTK